MCKRILIIICISTGLLSTSMTTLTAQAYYTQLEQVEPFLSPSLNGLSPNRDLRVNLAYRSNNLNLLSPFHTAYLNVDGRAFARYFNNRAWVGWGVGGIYDVAGAGGLTTNTLLLNLTYHQMIGATLLLSGGIGVGLTGKTLTSLGNLRFPIQWDGAGFNQTINNGESNLVETSNTIDLRAGINLTFLFSQNTVLTLGVSAQNITEPVETFYLNGTSEKTPTKYAGFLQLYHNINDLFNMKNSLYYSLQQGNSNLLIGSFWEWTFSAYYENIALLFGAYYRDPNVITPMVGLRYNNFRITLSYDVYMEDYASIDYFYRMATESNLNYYMQYKNNTFEELITVCPNHF